jgi:hypothetical protein
MKRLLYFSGFSILLLIFLALFVPTTYFEVKVVIFLLALISMMVLTINSKLVWTKQTWWACFLLSSVGLANSLHGQIENAPGAFRVLSVMTVWPMCYTFFSALLNQPNSIRRMASTFKAALVAILLYSFLYLGNMAGLIPSWMYFELDQGQNVNFDYFGTVEYAMYSVSSLLFLIPFWGHYLLKSSNEGKSKRLDWILLLIGLVLCVLTGRRAVQLVVFATPLIVLFSEIIIGQDIRGGFRLLWNFLNWKNFLLLNFLILILILILDSMGIRFASLIDNFILGFDFKGSSDAGAAERGNQFDSLMGAWYDGNYLFGAGNGSHTDYLRSDPDIMPWAYELTYVYLLFSTGIAGVLFYFGWFGWGLLRIRKDLISHPEMASYVVPMISGTFGLAIGSASNPYFGKFDYLWVILLPHLIAGSLKYQKNTFDRCQ